MGFSMWAHGYRGHKRNGLARTAFHYSKDNCLDQGDFEPPALLSMIPDSPDAVGVATKIVGTPESHLGGATVKGIFKIAELEFAHLLMQGVNLLAIHGSSGSISLYTHQTKWYWADSNSFDNFVFYGSNPGREFLKTITPSLKKTNLNNFGVLAQIAIVISKYDASLKGRVQPMLRMEVRH